MFKKILFLYLVVVSLSLLLQSCCEVIYKVTADFEVGFYDLVDEVEISPETDTIRGPFLYGLGAIVIADNSNWSEFMPISSLYAISCAEVYENGYIETTARVVLDKPFMVDDQIIEPGTDLLTLDDDFKSNIVYPPLELDAGASEHYIQVSFSEKFIARSHFPDDIYTFKTTVKMADGTIILSEEAVRIDIE
jgi:hypothetical protein